MLFHAYNFLVQYDLTNKFYYKSYKNLPKVKFIVLNLTYSKIRFKTVIVSLLFLELITNKKGKLFNKNIQTINLKVKKGSLIGCRLIMSKKLMFCFLVRLQLDRFLKNRTSWLVKYKSSKTIYRCTNLLLFFELSQNYSMFNRFQSLTVSIVTSTKTINELTFLLHFLRLPAKN